MKENLSAALPPQAAEVRLLSTKQVQEMLGVGKTTLHHLTFAKKNPLPSLLLGSARKYRIDKVLWWIENRGTY